MRYSILCYRGFLQIQYSLFDETKHEKINRTKKIQKKKLRMNYSIQESLTSDIYEFLDALHMHLYIKNKEKSWMPKNGSLRATLKSLKRIDY